MKTQALVLVTALLAASPARADTPRIPFEKHVLPNGLQLILHVDRKLPMVNVNLWYHVGSKNEKPGRTGFAHLFEHIMFQGSKNAPGEYLQRVEKAGASLSEGGANGTTSQDRTNYFETVPAGNLENILWLESDRLATLADALDQKNLDGQRDVVKNERRQRYENTPYGRWIPLVLATVFPHGHPYSWAGIGSHEDLSAASLDDVKEFFRRWYSPNNLSLVIAGDFDPAQARKLVDKYFGTIPTGPALDRPDRYLGTLAGEKVVAVRDRVPQERTYFAWPTPAFFDPDDAELDLAARILADGLASRLSRTLVYDKQLASTVSAFQAGQEIAGFFVVSVTARPGADLAEVERLATAEIARLAKQGPTAAELARARNKQEYEMVSGLERIGGFGGKADRLNQYNTFLGDPGRFEDDLARYRSATRESVRRAVARWLDTPNRAVVRFHPENVGRGPEIALDRSKEPAFGTDPQFKAPAVREGKLDNGLAIFVVERPDLPKVAVRLVTRAGAAADPAGKAGLANLTVRTIDMGTRARKALDIENALGDLGTALVGSTGREQAYLEVEALKRNLGAAVDILADVVQRPVFPAAEVAREQKRQLDALAQALRNPSTIAARLRLALVYGAEHPYGRPTDGSPATVAKLTRDDLAAFHAERWKAGGSALIFAGDITLDEATALARKHFGGWAAGTPPALSIPAPRLAAPGKVYLVDVQDAAQSVVSILMPGVPRRTPDYDALVLADAVWGGGRFSTRLNLNLREDKAYSYGVFSALSMLSSAGSWTASGGVHTAKTKEAVVEFRKELEHIAGARPITEAEFGEARAGRVRGYAQGFESLSRIADQVASNWVNGLPMTELQREVDAAARVTVEQARAAAKQHVRVADSSLLIVGDRAKIEAGLRELKLGDIVLLDAEGKPASAAAASR
jgi:zinc protease